jgi:hypothetical protein
MTDTAIFLIGTVVTLLAGGAVAMLVWAAVLDGRTEAEAKAEAEARRTAESQEPVAVPAPA